MERPLVSIIIVNFNGKRFLKECLSTVLGSKYTNFEVILVDNASTDKSLDFVNREFKERRLKVISNHENLGFGPANNIGFEQAKGKYIVFLNNDTSVETEWLTTMVDALEKDETIGLASSLVLNTDGKTIQTAGFLMCDYHIIDYWIGANDEKFKTIFGSTHDSLKTVFPEVFEISFAMGASMIARREFLEEIGLFDPKYVYYYDDDYLSFRTWLAGKRVVTVSGSKMRHFLGGTSWRAPNRFNEVFGYRWTAIDSASMIFDIYWNLLDLTKGLLIFFMRTYVYDLLSEIVEQRTVIKLWGSLSGAFWMFKNFKHVWGNRLKYWSKAAIDEKTLRSKMIKINIPTSLYLAPRLWKQYYKSETDKYRQSLICQRELNCIKSSSKTQN